MQATCPQCQHPLPANSPAGLCPACLLKAAAEPEPAPENFIDIASLTEIAARLPQFEIIELLGRGGMGVVYKARQRQLDRLVAIKVLPPLDALSPDFVARFTREARALARLNHPNIVHVYDFGEASGLYYIVMEYVEGMNLRQVLQARSISPKEALAMVPKICDALDYAHEEGIVHRDIKPENLLIDKRGRVLIADFGLAKILQREPLDLSLTLSGVALGTVRYMAPEQLATPETVDHRADVYSLGVVIYEMLTGELPIGRFDLPSQKAHVDTRLDGIVLRALEKDVDRRYQHASEVKEAVENLTETPAPTPPTTSTPAAQISSSRAEPRLSKMALIGIIWASWIFVAGFAYLTLTTPQQVGPGHPAEDGVYTRPIWAVVASAGVMVLAITAPLGTTILGWLAVGKIKRSQGRLYGLPLAVIDGLFFPLLILFIIVMTITNNLLYTNAQNTFANPRLEGALVSLIVCGLVAWFTWKRIAADYHPPKGAL